MKAALVVLALCLIACSKEPSIPQPPISKDAQAERAATIESFVGEWEYYLNSEPYMKIVIEKNGSGYAFKHYVKMAKQYTLDNVYYPQEILPKTFVAWDKAPQFRPYITIESTYVNSKSIISYRVDSSIHYLELGSSKYKKS